MPTLAWRWAVDANHTRAGIVAASLSPVGDGIIVYGMMVSQHAPGLACSIRNGMQSGADDRMKSQWVPVVNATEIPEARGDRQSFGERYKHKWPSGAGMVEVDNALAGARFVCPFSDKLSRNNATGSILVRRARHFAAYTISVRSSTGWQIDNVTIHSLGYPIVDGFEDAADSGMVQSALSIAPTPSVRTDEVQGADVTVCVQYVYGTGYSRSTLLEFAAWYYLLGARRIVVFDSIESDLEPGDGRHVAQERQGVLHALAAALGNRFVVVRGLATWDMMRRTRSHMSAQTLAGNMCKAAAGALAVPGRATYALLADIDEFLSPPSSDASMSQRIATRLEGSLGRLALHVDRGSPATALYLQDAAAVASRVHRGHGTGRCLSFASVYYYTRVCDDSNHASSRNSDEHSSSNGRGAVEADDAQPAILRRSWRGWPDNFEDGPSHLWRGFSHWNFHERSKFLVDAIDDQVLTGAHECCCRPMQAGGKQCSSRNSGLEVHTCATLEFMPLEHWHVRHLKGSGLRDGFSLDPCRRTKTVSSIKLIAGERQHVTIEPEEVSFPRTWAAEYQAALDNLARTLEAKERQARPEVV